MAGKPDEPCIFTSFGETFHGSPASLGAPIDVAPPVSMCSPATDPANDHCARPIPE